MVSLSLTENKSRCAPRAKPCRAAGMCVSKALLVQKLHSASLTKYSALGYKTLPSGVVVAPE
ncbi:hypothetical protein T190_32260 [Sinorhizobium meliloti CCBAU 01290]|nr:hypothetical protein T190_32260 [Sinorhizobium meliloti CCBAU 01290]